MAKDEKGKKNRRKKGTGGSSKAASLTSAHVALLGVLVAVALLFSYIETFINITIAVPGIKIGLANIVTIIVLISLGARDAFIVSGLRIFLATLLFGTLAMLPYSLGGAVVSILFMWIVSKMKFFSAAGVSVVGAVAHNMGQILVAYIFLSSKYVFAYAPVLIISGSITGILVGIVAGVVLRSVGREISK